MSIAQAEQRLEFIVGELMEVVNETRQQLEEARQQKRTLEKIEITGAEAASIIGYGSVRTLYNRVQLLRDQGYFTDGYKYMEAIMIRDWMKDNRLEDIPPKKKLSKNYN